MKKWNPTGPDHDVVMERLRFNVPAESMHIGEVPKRGGSIRPIGVRMIRPDGRKLRLNGRTLNLENALAKGWTFYPWSSE